jgi:hypothetical protein
MMVTDRHEYTYGTTFGLETVWYGAGGFSVTSLVFCLLQLIETETAAREVRSICYEMNAAEFPHHKDFAIFDYRVSAINKTDINPLCSG